VVLLTAYALDCVATVIDTMEILEHIKIYRNVILSMLITVAARCNAWVCGRSLAGVGGFQSRRGHGCVCLVSVVFCQVDVSAWG
jgi:hypothetical protein